MTAREKSDEFTPKLERRAFNRLLAAAFAGVAAGVVTACGKSGGEASSGATAPESEAVVEEAKDPDLADIDPNLLAEEPHVCRGLNTCKGKAKGGANACAGQGACATVDTHVCNGTNDCKGQGGCGEYPGQNTCKGKGACAVPLTDKTWAKARPKFEQVMASKGIKFGAAPPK